MACLATLRFSYLFLEQAQPMRSTFYWMRTLGSGSAAAAAAAARDPIYSTESGCRVLVMVESFKVANRVQQAEGFRSQCTACRSPQCLPAATSELYLTCSALYEASALLSWLCSFLCVAYLVM